MTHPRLTSLAKTAGCAAKISQADLQAALAHLPRTEDSRVLVGPETGDDAAIVRLTDELALVETVDVFTPIVDDPWDYGRIAAANALSDVYAMGGRPLSALSFVAWPVSTLGTESLGRLLQGAATVCAEAGITIAGGHSIVDEEPKFGLFVTGLVHPSKVTTNSGARPGDRLVLTKRLGTGILTTAVKRGHLPLEGLQPAIDSMVRLNRAAAEAMMDVGVQAATDVTGFGLLGHLGNVVRASRVAARIEAAAVPWLDGVLDFAERDVCPAGSKRNLAYASPNLVISPEQPEHVVLALADAQTSGGLLIAVRPDRHAALLDALATYGVPVRQTIGTILDGEPGRIEIV